MKRSRSWSGWAAPLVALVIGLAGSLLASSEAEAIPAFARATELPCSACHTSWPKLNRFGRAYKENGYAIERGNPEGQLEIGDKLAIPAHAPISIVANSRPYDWKKGSGRAKLRALHELEVLAGGSLFNYGSFFGELAMEDENNFDPEVEHAWIGVHPFGWLNLIAGYAPVFAADPYNTLADRRFTRARAVALDTGFGSNVKLKSSGQMVSAYGRVPGFERLFGLVTYSKDRSGDFEGEGSNDYAGRLALDVTDWATIGAFVMAGEEDGLNFNRAGGDLQLQLQPWLNLESVGYDAYDQRAAGDAADSKNFVWSTEVYPILGEDVFGKDLPDWFFQVVPILRTDYYTVPTQSQKRTDMVLNLTYFGFQNARVSLEYAQQLHGEGDAQRVTFYLVFAL